MKKIIIQEKINGLNSKISLMKIKIAAKGDSITFGQYEQGNGIKSIEWLVLDKTDEQVFIISKYGLDCQFYHLGDKAYPIVSWSECSLRKWLNRDFISKAFTDEEQRMIADTKCVTEDNLENLSPQEETTIDKVFLLSVKEAETFFSTDNYRECKATVYAKSHEAEVYDEKCSWWLRSSGLNPDEVDFTVIAVVQVDGSIFYDGLPTDWNGVCVRPALRINLNP